MVSDARIMPRRYESKFKFTWSSTSWLLAASCALLVDEKRKNSVMPMNTMPTTATAVNERDKMNWMLDLR
ncbi:hypothetical protein SDC9_201621 [bioreactor metagenome]|uniref:Uncharacterized protein n=1 Tax=bioreactor metagenome TaxID=1076179 RepID=A0A645IT06_9ZZZZ